ncbi:MAG: Glycine cleavage system H protein [Candidatus Scalindua arabica]|uniref:Glycine cleavage system H protein n=1 Tax=Candidatus Scalindua arabica TaxID=1127984 RepID=A0A941W4D7_9BACT|nr:Glycine cleavage system H protein [Candidatus Scalindua arabica]
MKKEKLKYSLDHNWVELKRKVVTIGVTDYFIDELGDLIDLCLPKVNEDILLGISYGEIESLDVLHDLMAPVNGEIVKVNSDLITTLRVLQKNPFDDGWFIKVRIADPEQLDTLMDEDEYEEYKKSIRKKGQEAVKKKVKVKGGKKAERKKKPERKKKAERKKRPERKRRQ